eukprot:COSAG02_NODE_37987_length_435_cov_0.613095_1_plen_66_part_10
MLLTICTHGRIAKLRQRRACEPSIVTLCGYGINPYRQGRAGKAAGTRPFHPIAIAIGKQQKPTISA